MSGSGTDVFNTRIEAMHTRMPLAQVAEAHRRREARQTTGATVLLP